jgi:hypothetical protein
MCVARKRFYDFCFVEFVTNIEENFLCFCSIVGVVTDTSMARKRSLYLARKRLYAFVLWG